MENNTEQLLDAYFANTLTQGELADMKARLASDPDFAAEFAWRKSLAQSVRKGMENDPMKIKLRELERRFRFRKIVMQASAIAASVAAIIVALWYLSPTQNATPTLPEVAKDAPAIQTPQVNIPPKDQVSTEEKPQPPAPKPFDYKSLVANNFQPYDNLWGGNSAGSLQNEQEAAAEAFTLYDEAKYREASESFKNLTTINAANVEYQFYYGVALLGSKKYSDAAAAFKKVTEKQGKYQTPSKYYLGLAYLGAGKYDSGRQSLQAYLNVSDDDTFKAKTSEMLKKLPKQ